MQLSGRCFCTFCRRPLEGLVEVDDHVWLSRRCPEHGAMRTMLYTDTAYFKTAILQSPAPRHRCLIVEVTDRCDVGCVTCSAQSIDKGNDKPLGKLVHDTFVSGALTSAKVVGLSGGEPLMRRDLWQTIDALSAGFRRIVLITSGKDFETRPDILKEIAARSSVLEIYLQFDSLDNDVLRALRTPQMNVELRKERLRLAVATGAATSAVCVVPPHATEQSIQELARFCRDAGAQGVTFQPLRQLGRFPDIAPKDLRMGTVDFIQNLALEALGFARGNALPFAQQPFDISVAMLKGPSITHPPTFFPTELAHEPYFRVATSSYWDYSNYFAPFARSDRYYFFVDERTPLNAHYFNAHELDTQLDQRSA